MVELIVVIVLIGILSAVAIPRLALLQGYKDVGYRDKLKATLEYARKSAVAQRRWACVTIASTSVTLNIEKTLPENHTGTSCPSVTPNPLNLPVPDSSCTSANMICVPSNVTTASTSGPGVPATILYDPEGRPSTGIVLSITDSSVPSTSTLTLEAESGYVY